ncbi:MAG: hypothetical protein ISP68_01770 [Flavobacteriaceae bacterium]|nr:hypothetical protein [Flavobacteriaceae bacterium]
MACTQNAPSAPENSVIGDGENMFFTTPPDLTPITVDENQVFAPLFAQLSDLPKIPYKNLSVQLQAIGQEADKIKPRDFPNALQIPQLIGRYKVFRTRIGIVRFSDPSQYTQSKFSEAMNEVVVAWNTFARHYNRVATQPSL